MHIKKYIYRFYEITRKIFWFFTGGRKEKMFGYNLSFVSATCLSESIWFHYPKRSVRQRIVMYTDYVQAHSMVAYLESLPDKPVVVEVGAYHGQYAVLLGKIVQAKNGRLIAVEASPKNAKVLRQNVQLNCLDDIVEVVESFVQDTGGKDISLIERGSQTTVDLNGKDDKIRSESIAALLHRLNIRGIDLLLIDIEGAEVKLLPAYPWADVPVECIYCEIHPGEWHRFGDDGSNIERVIKEQHLVCLDMYFQPFSKFRKRHYAGPTILIQQPWPSKS